MFGHYFSAGPIPNPVVIAGRLPAPLESSRPRGWNGIVVERYRANDVEVIAQSSAALITIHLGPPVTVVQTRCKKDDRRRLTKGDITVTQPGKSKGWQHRGQADFVAVWIAPELIRNTAAAAGESRPERVKLRGNFGTRDPQIEQLGLSLLSELEAEGFGDRLYAESIASALAVHLLRRYSTAGATVGRTATMLPSFKLRRATQYINDNLGRNLALSEIARTLAMSSYHFSRVFKQTTGVAPHHYLIARRVECAKSLLRETDLSISEIAHRVGCTNQSHFSVLFHRATAMTPSMFRQQR
jgi:AraC family transcriptional regulator